jgi:hypothetical protein
MPIMGCMSQRNNNTSHFLIELSDGTSFAEKCRDSIGGWQNMEARINERFGLNIMSADRLRMSATTDGAGTIAGLNLTATKMLKL